MGRGLLGILKKIISIFNTWQRMLTKFGQLKKLKCREGSQLCKLSQLRYHFCHVLKNEITFFFISLAIFNPLQSRIHCHIIFSKKIDDSVYFQKKKSNSKLKRREGSQKNLSLFLFLKIYRNINLFGKIDWSMNSGSQWARDG